jgi:parvulin-like peptidyl-prolyl isomerase
VKARIPAIVLVWLLSGPGLAFASGDGPVIELGETTVTRGQLNDRFQVAVRVLATQQGVSIGDQSPAVVERLRVQYLDKHAMELVLLQEAARREVAASPADVENAVAKTLATDEAKAEIVDSLRDSGIDGENLLRQIVRDEQTIKLVTEQLLEEIVIPPGDVVTLHHDIKHTLIEPEEVCIRHIQTADSEAAETILAELEGGAEFEKLASERSIDRETAVNGGDLGCFHKGPTESARTDFEKAAFAARRTGIIGPVESELGFHVMSIYRYKAPHELTLNEAYADVERELKHEQLPSRINALISDSGIKTYPENFSASDTGG